MKTSIIITAHKDRGYLKECILSCKETVKYCKKNDAGLDFEIILASDGCAELKQIAKSHNIKFNLSPKSNMANSFNNAVKIATGEYLRIIADDDLFNADGFLKLCQRAKTDKPDVIISNYSSFKNDVSNLEREYITNIEEDDRNLLTVIKKRKIGCGTTLIKKSSFIAVGGFDSEFNISEGYILWLKLLYSEFNDFFFENVCSVYYRLHSTQKSQNLSASDKSLREANMSKINAKYCPVQMQKITQCNIGTSVKFFGKRFLQTWKLTEYNNPNEPAVFFGMYPPDRELLLNHKNTAVVVWAGSDALDVDNLKVLDKPNIIHIAGNKYLETDLISAGIKNYKIIPITVLSQESLKLKALPLGNKIYVYPKVLKSMDIYSDFYGNEIVKKLIDVFGEERFILANPSTYTHEQLYNEIYPQCFIGLRLVPHDGLSETVVELGLLGRKVIYNGIEPNVINYSSFGDIVTAIKNEEKNIGKTLTKVAKDMNKYISIGESWLNVEINKL